MTGTTRALCTALLAGAVAASAASAQTVTGRIVRVVEPAATVAAVSDRLAVLAVAVRGTNDYQVALYGLDGRGAPTGAPQQVRLPVPSSLQGFATYASGLAFHPRLPLLYVWQDIAYQKPAGDPAKNPAYSDFDHLVVLQMEAGGRAVVAGASARGPRYVYGQGSGRIAVDDLGRRIYLPNVANPRISLGYLRLETNGLPRAVEGVVEPVTVDVADIRPSTGQGFVAFTNGILLFAGSYGPALWDTGNRLAGVNTIAIRGGPADGLIGGVPGGSSIYGAGADVIYRMAHAEGYLTLLPQTMTVPGAAFSSTPVVMTRAPAQVVVGGAGGVYAIPVDAEGRLSGAAEKVTMGAAFVRGLAYSERFDRLYAAVSREP